MQFSFSHCNHHKYLIENNKEKNFHNILFNLWGYCGKDLVFKSLKIALNVSTHTHKIHYNGNAPYLKKKQIRLYIMELEEEITKKTTTS